MQKRFEKSLSQILSLVVLIVFITTLLSAQLNIWIITYVWAVSFILAWVLMLVYGLHVLMQKESFGTSILVAIITALGFLVLSVPAILVLSRFIPGLPVGLTFGNEFLNANNQLILYTSLIITYFIHLLNATRLKRKSLEDLSFPKETEGPITSDELELNQSSSVNEDFSDDTAIETESLEQIKSSIDDSEKIVFESNIDKKLEYNTQEVIIVEDLTEEDLRLLEGEEDNG